MCWCSWPGQLKPSGVYTLWVKKEYPNFHLNMNGLGFFIKYGKGQRDIFALK
jgi:hypothetical protein